MAAENDGPQKLSAPDAPDALRAPEAAPRPRRLAARAPGDPKEWTEHDGKHAELVELRASVGTLRRRLEELTGELERARRRELALRGGLQRLAAAGLRRRRFVLAELRARQLVR